MSHTTREAPVLGRDWGGRSGVVQSEREEQVEDTELQAPIPILRQDLGRILDSGLFPHQCTIEE